MNFIVQSPISFVYSHVNILYQSLMFTMVLFYRPLPIFTECILIMLKLTLCFAFWASLVHL